MLFCQPACDLRLTAAVLLLFSAMGLRGAASALLLFFALSLGGSDAQRRKPKLEVLDLAFKPWRSPSPGSGHLSSLPSDRGDGTTLFSEAQGSSSRGETSPGPGGSSTDGSATIEAALNDKGVSFLTSRELYDPLGRSALRLYHKVLREAVQGMAKPRFRYVQTHSYMRILLICNPILGSLLPDPKDQRQFLGKLEKAVKKGKEKQQAELQGVLKVLAGSSGASLARISGDASLLRAAQHLVYHVRSAMRHGLPGFFEALTSDAVFTIAHSMLYVGTSLGYSFKSMLQSRLTLVKSCLRVAMAVQNIAGAAHVFPVGVVGVVLRLFLRAFNMVFFPQLLAMTGGLTVAMGLACLTGVPRLFAKIYKFVTTRVTRGVIAAIKYAQIFRLRKDPQGAAALKRNFGTGFARMITTMWQLDLVDVDAVNDSGVHGKAAFASEMFSHGFFTGIVDFAKEYATLVEYEYLAGYEEAVTKCYEQTTLLLETKLACEGIYRRTEVFSARSRGVLSTLSWISFRDYVAELMLMVYRTAKVLVETQSEATGDLSPRTLKNALKEDGISDFTAAVALRPRLRRDIHNITTGISGIVSFFELRKLHRWRPLWAEGSKTGRAPAQVPSEAREAMASLSGGRQALSLVNQRLEAFVAVDLPPGWVAAAPQPSVLDGHSASFAETVMSRKLSTKRDLLMISLFRRSTSRLINALNSVFGKLEHMLRAATRKEIHTCSLSDRSICWNSVEATNGRFAILQFLVAAHLGAYIGPSEKFNASLIDLQQDFMQAIKDVAWARYKLRPHRGFRRRIRWGLDMLIDHLFPEREWKPNDEEPLSSEQLALLEQAVSSNQKAAINIIRKQFKVARIQCAYKGSLFVLTTEIGRSKVFRPESAIPPAILEQLCTPEHEFIKVAAWYKQKEVGGQLNVPGIADINGYIADASLVLASKQEDENVGYLVEAALWSKGLSRIDARMAADLLIATKRRLYQETSWLKFFNEATPADMDYVQHSLPPGMRLGTEVYIDDTPKSLYSFDMSPDAITDVLVRALESTLITATSLGAGLSDLALATSATLAVEAFSLAERRVTGLTSMLARFQRILWEEFAARKQCLAVKPLFSHEQTSHDVEAPTGPQRVGSSKRAISDAFAQEEGNASPIYDDWCEEIYSLASSSPQDNNIADLNAHDAGVIKCSLLRFLGKRFPSIPQLTAKKAAFTYLNHVVEQLRAAKKTNKYSWKTYLNARPTTKGEAREQAASVLAAIRRSFISLRRRMSHRAGKLVHKIRSEAAKKLFGRRAFNILRGQEFLRVLQLAAVEAFGDQAFFPSELLVSPKDLAAFTRFSTIMRYEVQPIMNRKEGLEVVTQIKMTPTPSPSMRLLIGKLKTQLLAARDTTGPAFRRHVRQCAGYLWMLHAAKVFPGFLGGHLAPLFSRFALLHVDPTLQASRGQRIVSERNLAYVEQTGIKLALKAGDAVNLLRELALELPAQLLSRQALGLLSVSAEGFSESVAGRKSHEMHLGIPSVLLFCKLRLNLLEGPEFQLRWDASMAQLREFQELLSASELPVNFQVNREATTPSFDFNSIDTLVRAAERLRLQGKSELPEATAAFLLHAPLMMALEIMGFATETVGHKFGASPLECTPEDRSSGTWYTTPVNSQSLLRMVASALLYIADAEEIEESLYNSDSAFMPPVSPDYNETEKAGEARSGGAGARPFSSNNGKSPSHQVNFGDGPTVIEAPVAPHLMEGRPVAFGSSTVMPASEVEEASSLQLQARAEFDQGQQEAGRTKEGHFPEEGGKSNFERPVDPDEAGGRKGIETILHSSPSYPGNAATETVDEDLANAQTTTRHLRQQLSAFGFHSSAFVSTLHLLFSVSQLPSKLFTRITRRFSDVVATAVLGGPRRRPKKWQNRLGSRVRKILSRRPARKPFDTAAGFAVPEEAAQVETAFSTLFLPASVERLMHKIRKAWKHLKNSEYLSVKSCACKQDADLWRQEELQANSEAPPAATQELGEIADRAENERRGRLELCDHPLWLQLHAKVSLEQSILEKQQLFRFFLRMGVENVQLLQKAANQALHDHLWEKLAAMGWLNAAETSEMASSAILKAQEAIKKISKKHAVLEVPAVSELILAALEGLVRTPGLTREGLRHKMEVLQRQAVDISAAFLLTKTAAVGPALAEEAIQKLQRHPSSDLKVSQTAGGPEEEASEQRLSGMEAWLMQAYFASDPLLLLSRPNIFNPAVTMLEILHRITSPKSLVQSMWKKGLKSARQLTSASLDLLLRLPRAYIHFPRYRRRKKKKT